MGFSDSDFSPSPWPSPPDPVPRIVRTGGEGEKCEVWKCGSGGMKKFGSSGVRECGSGEW